MSETEYVANGSCPVPRGERVARRPDAIHGEAGRAFARRRVMDTQGGQCATAGRRVRGQFRGEKEPDRPTQRRSGDGKPSPYKTSDVALYTQGVEQRLIESHGGQEARAEGTARRTEA